MHAGAQTHWLVGWGPRDRGLGRLARWFPQGGGWEPQRGQPTLAQPLLPPPHSQLYKESIQTRGFVDSSGRVHCVSPLLYETGRIPFTLSMDNGRSFPRSGTWLAGETQHAGPDWRHQAAPSRAQAPHRDFPWR